MSAHPAGPLHAETLPAVGAPARPADLSVIDPAIWPLTAKRIDGELHLGGTAVTELVKQHGTPTVFLDEADFRARARGYATAFAGVGGEQDADVYYASKAFLSRGVAKWAEEENLGIDVCTGGELATVLSAGFPPERITLHGNNKSVEELAAALDAGVGHIVLDSFEEISRLAKLAAERGVTPKVLIRVTVGVEAHTHEFIATAHEDQKFGFSLSSGSAAEAARRVLNTDELHLVGLHSHIGSQIFDTAGFSVSSHRLVGLLAEIDAEHGVTLDELNLGGGLGIAYVSGDDPTDVREVAAQLRAIVAAECRAAGLAMPRLSVEPGRALIGPAGVTLYRVGTVKDVDGIRTYVSVDGGMSDNIRTALYDAKYTCVLANRVSEAEPMLSRVVGKHCESGDIVIRDVWLPGDVQPGDLLAVAATGAYCRSMASNYNYVARPPVVAVADGESRTLVRRETIEDILRLDVG